MLREHEFYEYHELLKIIDDKNIQIESEAFAINALKNYSYYTLINGYKHHFLQPNETDLMIDGTKFDDFVDVYFIDKNMSSLILKYILSIEKSLRARAGHTIAKFFGIYTDDYLNREHYTNFNRLRGRTLHSISKVSDDPRFGSNTYYYKHNKTNIPPWIIINDVSFYDCINWICIIRDRGSYKEKPLFSILTDFYRNSDIDHNHYRRTFYYSFQFLREYRNFAAHNRRDFQENLNFKISPDIASRLFPSVLYTDEDIMHDRGTHDLLAAINLILVYTVDKRMLANFYREFILLLIDYVDDVDYRPNKFINGKSIYEVLNLPNNITQRITSYINTMT